MTKQVTYTRKAKNAKTHEYTCICGKTEMGRKGQKFCCNACKQCDKNERAKEDKDANIH